MISKKISDELAADMYSGRLIFAQGYDPACMAGLKLASLRDEFFKMNKAEIKRMGLDLPEGQCEYYPATSAGYCLRASNERSERAANEYNWITIHIVLLNQFKSTNLEKNHNY